MVSTFFSKIFSLPYYLRDMKDKAHYQKKFGSHLKKVLKKHGVSAAELSRRVFMEESHMSRLIKGGTNPTFHTIITICKALDMTINEFFDGFEE